MKSVKLMLLSFCVLAVVAGALAFKAKGTLDYCTAATVNDGSGNFCPSIACPTENKKITTNLPNIFLCTAATSGVLATPCKVGGISTNPDITCGTTSSNVRIEP